MTAKSSAGIFIKKLYADRMKIVSRRKFKKRVAVPAIFPARGVKNIVGGAIRKDNVTTRAQLCKIGLEYRKYIVYPV